MKLLTFTQYIGKWENVFLLISDNKIYDEFYDNLHWKHWNLCKKIISTWEKIFLTLIINHVSSFFKFSIQEIQKFIFMKAFIKMIERIIY